MNFIRNINNVISRAIRKIIAKAAGLIMANCMYINIQYIYIYKSMNLLYVYNTLNFYINIQYIIFVELSP